MNTETVSALAHGRMMEAEAGGAAQRVLRVQVEVAQLTPEQQVNSTGRTPAGVCVCVCACGDTPVTAEALHVVFAATLSRVDVTLLSAAGGRASTGPGGEGGLLLSVRLGG